MKWLAALAAMVIIVTGPERDVEARLRAVSGWDGRVILRKSGELNAWSDGRNVILTDGLIRKTSPDELAFVMAHEIAHSRLPKPRQPADELAADLMAVRLTRAAGYDPVAGAVFLRRIDAMGRWSVSHPPVQCRADAIRAMVAIQ